MRRRLLFAVSAFIVSLTLQGQTKNFDVAKWTQIQRSILKELNQNYVDSLQVGRIERAGIDAMLSAIDPYTVYVPEEENENFQMMIGKVYGGVGAIIYKPEKDGYVTINEPYAGSPAAKAGLICGDEIRAIDGVSVVGLQTKDCSDRMKGQPGTTVTLTVKKLRTSEVVDIKIVREKIHLPDVEYYGMLDDTTGYILQTGFTEGVGAEVRSAVKEMKKQGMKRLVLDLRGNGGGLLREAVNIVSIFVPKGSVVATSKGNTKESYHEYKTTAEPEDTTLPVYVFVDGGTASSSEIVTGALQDYKRATVLGERTYGKGLVQSVIPLPFNGQLKVTTAKYYTPSGRCVQELDYANRDENGKPKKIEGAGIAPDIEVKYTPVSRLVYSLVAYQVIEHYTMEYVKTHADYPGTASFHLEDKDWDAFVEFAKGEEFDYRSTAKAAFDIMKQDLEEDGLKETMAGELAAIEKKLEMEKEEFLQLKKKEIVPLIEEEIATRYEFQRAGIEIRLRYDEQLKEGLKKIDESK